MRAEPGLASGCVSPWSGGRSDLDGASLGPGGRSPDTGAEAGVESFPALSSSSVADWLSEGWSPPSSWPIFQLQKEGGLMTHS